MRESLCTNHWTRSILVACENLGAVLLTIAAVLTGVVRHFFLCFSEDLVILVEGEGEKSSKYLKILFVEGCPLGKGKITWLIPLKNEVQHMFSVVKTPSCFAMK